MSGELSECLEQQNIGFVWFGKPKSIKDALLLVTFFVDVTF
jgi:hypothetical protein